MPGKRPAKKRATRTPRQRSKRESRPNVYVQSKEAQRPQDQDETGTSPSPGSTTSTRIAAARPRSVRRQGRQRSEVFARTLPAELRKLSVLVGGIAVILAVLTVVLRQTA